MYWSTAGAAPGWTSADATPVTDGQWHHIAVVFDGGAITFYKDGVATADRLTVSGTQQAAGTFQLGAGFGSATGFMGELYDVRVWSVARSAQQIASWRWAPLSLTEPGLTARTSFDAATQQIINLVGGAAGSITAGTRSSPPTCRLRPARCRSAAGLRTPSDLLAGAQFRQQCGHPGVLDEDVDRRRGGSDRPAADVRGADG